MLLVPVGQKTRSREIGKKVSDVPAECLSSINRARRPLAQFLRPPAAPYLERQLAEGTRREVGNTRARKFKGDASSSVASINFVILRSALLAVKSAGP